MEEAAERLRISRRKLQDWLGDHPFDKQGRLFYSPMGVKKTFDEFDLYRIRLTAREEEEERLDPRRVLRGRLRPISRTDQFFESMGYARSRRKRKVPT